MTLDDISSTAVVIIIIIIITTARCYADYAGINCKATQRQNAQDNDDQSCSYLINR